MNRNQKTVVDADPKAIFLRALDYESHEVPQPPTGPLLIFGIRHCGLSRGRRANQLLWLLRLIAAICIGQFCISSLRADIVTFGSDTTWNTFDSSGKPIGNAQYVLNGSTAPTRRPPGATVYSPGNDGWAANLSTIPSAYWIWAPGITGDTTHPALATYAFSKQFNLAGTPVAGSISVAADDYAAVFLNGSLVGETGSTADGSVAFAAQSALKTFDLTAFLWPGSNTITVVGENGPFGDPTNYAGDPAGVVIGGALQFQPVPEPSTCALVGGAMCWLILLRNDRIRRQRERGIER